MKSVGIGEIVVTDDPSEVVQMVGLGSCIGVYAVVPGKAIAAAHVLLPSSGGQTPPQPGKFADTAIPELAKRLTTMGFARARASVTLVGGGQVLSLGSNRPEFDIGRRNADAVREALRSEGLRVVRDETGGNKARTFRMSASEAA